MHLGSWKYSNVILGQPTAYINITTKTNHQPKVKCIESQKTILHHQGDCSVDNSITCRAGRTMGLLGLLDPCDNQAGAAASRPFSRFHVSGHLQAFLRDSHKLTPCDTVTDHRGESLMSPPLLTWYSMTTPLLVPAYVALTNHHAPMSGLLHGFQWTHTPPLSPATRVALTGHHHP